MSVLACFVGACLLGAGVTLAQQPEPGEMAMPDRLAPPTMPAEPDQADQGAAVYYYNCMVCHGDRGQGLTDEFRSLWAPGDQNCWQAKCHGANHPPDGFEIVRYVPPVIGEKTLARSLAPQQLYNYLRTTMPRHDPGRLPDEEYWQLTAFLMRENGVDAGELPLGPEGTPDSRITAAATTTPPHLPADDISQPGVEPAALVGLGALLVLAVGWAVVRALRAKER